MKGVNNVHYENMLNKKQRYRDDDEHSAKDTAVEATSTQSDKSLTVFLPTNDVTMPTEQVGCTLITCHLQQFLEDYPPSSDKHTFLNVYQMLSLLDKYLYDNPRQHTHQIMNM